MFSTYDQSGIQLAYPESWRLTEETNNEARLQLSIASPDTAFWTLAIYDELLDPHSLAHQALEALQAEYPDAEASAVERQLADAHLIGHDLHFICLDLTVTAQIRAFHHDDESYLVFTQAEDRELETAAAVFDAILASLLGGK